MKKKKLRSRRGFSLTEMLITVLILGIMTAGVAAGTSASLRVYRESKLLSEAQMLCSTLSEAILNELHYGGSVNTKDGMITNASGNLLVGKGVYCNGTLCATAKAEKQTGGYYKVEIKIYSKADYADIVNNSPITSATFSVTPLIQ